MPNQNPSFARAPKSFKPIFWLSLLLVIVAAFKIYTDVFSANVNLKYEPKKEAFLTVNTNKDYSKVLAQIRSSYYFTNPESFIRLAALLKLEEKMKPGRYKLAQGMTNFELVRMIIKGRQEPLNLVLKYEERPRDLAGFVASQLEIDSLYFLSLLSDTMLVRKYGFDTLNILSMFIPNTYNLYWNTSAIAFLDRMHKEYIKFWNQERLGKAIAKNLSPMQVSVLASIVQKETNKQSEMPRVAGVYLNRIRKGIPLQADPTVIYAWDDKSIKRVTNIHTALESPYNTYQRTGLPPGPICTASIQAIEAVLDAEEHDFYYFCAKEDFSGFHAFAESLEQHHNNARRYQRALNQKGIY
jgi:UPF0755 protein